MKILIVFIDMVRVDYLHSYNRNTSLCLIDKRLERLGGSLFTRCYSPGPDTPRSMACMQSGLYPFFNGCDTRIKWPKFFMKEDVSTIWDHAANKGWKVNLCCNKNETLTGFFKYQESSQIRLFNSLDEFMGGGEFGDNSLSFIGIPDMHTAISDYNATEYAIRKGDEIVDLYFERFITDDYTAQFDYVFVFSDHGCQMVDESKRMKSSLELLDDGRNKLLMFIHQRGDVGLSEDNRLSSILDLYATLERLIGCTDFRHGFSLLDKPLRVITHVEDHKDFNVYPEIMIKQWRVISDDYDIRTDVKNTIINRGSDKDVIRMRSYLSEFSPHYMDYSKQLQVLGYYDSLVREDIGYKYFIGLDRPRKRELFFTAAVLKIKRVLMGK